MKKLFLILFLLMSVIAHADPAADLEKLLSQTNRSSGRFTQKTLSAAGVVLQQSSGDFQLEKPCKFYWNVIKPYPNKIIVDCDKATMIDPDLEQVTIRAINKNNVDQLPVRLLTGDASGVLDGFDISQQQNCYKLTTDQAGSIVKRLSICFNQNKLVSEIKFINGLDQVTDVRFTDLTYNQPVDETLFKADIPKGYDVVSQS